jgi:methionyl aminopeptidase
MAKKTSKAASAKEEIKVEETPKVEASVKVEEKIPVPEEKKEEKKELTEEEKKAIEEEEKEKQLRLDSFKKAGEVYRQVVAFIKPQVVVGAKLLDLCEKIEGKIVELGCDIGFPANLGINNVAAHYSPARDDTTVIAEGDIVKVDLGVAKEGYCVDGAFTVSFNKTDATKNMILAVETAVKKGLSMIKPGVMTNAVGEATYKIITGFGLNVIKDLAGHLIEQWNLHGGHEIPNFPSPSGEKFEEGQVWALECFASTGSGKIHATTNTQIYSYNINTDRIPIRSKVTRHVMGWIGEHKKTLPFSSRELFKEFKTGQFALMELTRNKKLVEHSVLKEEKDTFVAQAEETFMITKDGIEKLT